MMNNTLIRAEAKQKFAQNRLQAMLIYGVVYAILVVFAVLCVLLLQIDWLWWYSILLGVVVFVAQAPFSYAMQGFYVKVYRSRHADPYGILKNLPGGIIYRAVPLFLIRLGIGLLLSCLLIVPGVIFFSKTSMAMYLLRANPKFSPMEAIKESRRLMKGHIFQYITLNLFYLWWIIVGVLTLGMVFVWLVPYVQTARIVFLKRVVQGDAAEYRDQTSLGVEDDTRLANARKLLQKLEAEIQPMLDRLHSALSEQPAPVNEDFEASAAPKVAAEQVIPIVEPAFEMAVQPEEVAPHAEEVVVPIVEDDYQPIFFTESEEEPKPYVKPTPIHVELNDEFAREVIEVEEDTGEEQEAPAAAPAEADQEVPVAADQEAPAEADQEVPIEAPHEAPVEADQEAPHEVPVEAEQVSASAESVAEPHAEAVAEPHAEAVEVAPAVAPAARPTAQPQAQAYPRTQPHAQPQQHAQPQAQAYPRTTPITAPRQRTQADVIKERLERIRKEMKDKK